jgi:hypothetical protein
VLFAPLPRWRLWQLPEGRWQVQWLDYQLAPLAVDKLSRLFATIFALMALPAAACSRCARRAGWRSPPPTSTPARPSAWRWPAT